MSIRGTSSADTTYRARRMGDLPAEAARKWGDREALSFGERRWTHAEVAAEVDRVAKGLIRSASGPATRSRCG